MDHIAMIAFLRFVQRVQAFVKKSSENGQIHNNDDIRRCVEVTYAMSFDKNGNVLVDR